ncbi:MAG TPA: T9SS type A sorting domain-containing protein [Bacteroidia bacterium]
MKIIFYVSLLLPGVHSFAQSSHQQQAQGAKPGLWINGINCKIGHFTQSCTPKTCDSITLFPGDTIRFCTDADVDLASDTVYYMQWNFSGSNNYPSPVMNYAPVPTPVCYDAVYTNPGHYTIDVFYNGWLTAYPDRDCYSFGPSHWIVEVTVMPGANSVQEQGGENAFSITMDPANNALLVKTDGAGVMEFYSGLGTKEYSMQVNEGANFISTAGFADGIYFCRVTSGEKTLVKKMVIMK